MTYKPNLSRMARLAAGSRMPLPGQDPLREEELRIELAEELKPEGLLEKIWLEDIAYRIAVIEVIRAQIAGFKARIIRKSYFQLTNPNPLALDFDVDLNEEVFTPEEKERAEWFDRSGFIPRERTTHLADPSFALLVGDLGRFELEALRLLQSYEHEEARERDRIVNQFERRRRRAVQDAIALAEARRCAGLNETNPEDFTTSAGELPPPVPADKADKENVAA